MGCATQTGPAGRFEFVALETVVPVEILAFRVERRMCGSDVYVGSVPDHSRPVAAAITDVRGANIMTHAVISVVGGCVIVRGNVGRVR